MECHKHVFSFFTVPHCSSSAEYSLPNSIEPSWVRLTSDGIWADQDLSVGGWECHASWLDLSPGGIRGQQVHLQICSKFEWISVIMKSSRYTLWPKEEICDAVFTTMNLICGLPCKYRNKCKLLAFADCLFQLYWKHPSTHAVSNVNVMELYSSIYQWKQGPQMHAWLSVCLIAIHVMIKPVWLITVPYTVKELELIPIPPSVPDHPYIPANATAHYQNIVSVIKFVSHFWGHKCFSQ